MKNRIIKYEKIFDEIESCYNNLEKAFYSFKDKEQLLKELNNYYGSSNWYKDVEDYDNNNMDIKAGVLSQDGVWNLLEKISELKSEIKEYLDN